MSDPQRGTVALELSDEFPGLQIVYTTVPRVGKRTPHHVRERLATLSDRFLIARVHHMRQTGAPSAYRSFYRQVGVDPDVVRSPMDDAIFARLQEGGFRPRNHLHDAILLATMETHVPIWAMDAAGVVGGLGIRPAEEGETTPGEEEPVQLTEGQLVIVDANGPLVPLLVQPGPGRAVTPETEVILLFCLRVGGVPTLTVSETLGICTTMLDEV